MSLRKGAVFIAVLFVIWDLILILHNHYLISEKEYGTLPRHELLKTVTVDRLVVSFSILLGVDIILMILVIIGSIRRRKFLVLPWLIYSLLFAIAIAVWMGLMVWRYEEFVEEIYWIILGCWLGLWGYWWWMVVSIFRQIHEEDKIFMMEPAS